MPLNEVEHEENRVMRCVRIAVEWSYGQVSDLWTISSAHLEKQLEVDAEMVLAQVRVMHLLTNCYTCIHGNTISSHRSFCCNPPSLEEYLLAIPEPPENPLEWGNIDFF